MTCECDNVYIGTTTRSAYVRGNEHHSDLIGKNEDSDLWQHCEKKHEGQIQMFKMDVIETFKGDPLLRQVSEAVRISRTHKDKIMNRKEEYTSTKND